MHSDREIGGFIIRFQPISLQDKPLFDHFFRARRYDNSECTFTNLYMWRKAYGIEWAVDNEFLYLKGSWDGNAFAFAPFGRIDAGFDNAVLKLIEYFHVVGLREAKQSYRPIKMIEKYDIILTNTR